MQGITASCYLEGTGIRPVSVLGFSPRTRRALEKNGYVDEISLTELCPRRIDSIKGLGQKGREEVTRILTLLGKPPEELAELPWNLEPDYSWPEAADSAAKRHVSQLNRKAAAV